jgi:hypothetical protein
MELCVFHISLKKNYLDGSWSNECVYRSNFLKYDFYLFLRTYKLLPLYTIFLVSINIWEIFVLCFTTQVGLQFGTICLNMSTNINMNFLILGDHLISSNSMLNQNFISWTGKKKTSLLFSNIMISQMIKTKKLKF